ncbi:MAG: SGNH/GDSL hydrolase family protein [Candidatus Omnitrophica bacterium]|nr:SGNH/GDSL hydrolase family protein [Candidatus Omnitrophota bacterium]
MKKFIAASVVILILLVITEISLRIFFGLGTPPLMVTDANIGYLYKANQDLKRFGNRVVYNKYHQRSENLAKNPGYRILMVGDSITNGGASTDHSDTVTEILEHKINQSRETTGEALNASAGSWGVENEYEYIKKFGTFEADIVILQIGTHDLKQPKAVASVVGTASYPSNNPPLAIWELFTRYVKARVFKKSSRIGKITPADEGKQCLKNLNTIKQTIALTKKSDNAVIALLIPERAELHKEKNAAQKEDFITLMDEHNIPCINLLDKKFKLEKRYFRDPIHFNKKGNDFIADILYTHIETTGLLDRHS